MKFLETDRILLRAVEPEDASIFHEIENDTEQWIENGVSAPYSYHNLKRYAEEYDADPIRSGQLRLVVESKTGIPNGTKPNPKKIIGAIDLYEISALNRTAFIGIYILKEARGEGFGEEALTLLETYARQLLNLRILGVKISSRNEASKKFFEKSGYSVSGCLPKWLLNGSEKSDLFILTKQL